MKRWQNELLDKYRRINNLEELFSREKRKREKVMWDLIDYYEENADLTLKDLCLILLEKHKDAEIKEYAKSILTLIKREELAIKLAECDIQRAEYCKKIGQYSEAKMLFLKHNLLDDVAELNNLMKSKHIQKNITVKDSIIVHSEIGTDK